MLEKNESDRAKPLDVHDVSSLAAYIGDMSAELAAMARRLEMPMLAYLLDLARLEAETCSHEPASGPKERRRRIRRANAA
jgi:hypothetical protein